MSVRRASSVVWKSLGALDDRQQVVFPSSVDIDVIGFYREETISAACVFVVREGRTVRTCEFILDKGLDVDEEELQSGFLKRYYDETADIPAEINLSVELEDAEALGEWLAAKRERSCHLHRPQRGEKHRLLDMASKNARHALMRYMMRTGYADDRTNQALLELESALALPCAAVAHRVLRYLDVARHLYRRFDGGIYQRPCRQGPVSSL